MLQRDTCTCDIVRQAYLLIWSTAIVFVILVATSISHGNYVIHVGRSQKFTCIAPHYPPHWHFYSLSAGSEPCGFDRSNLYEGVSMCPSDLRISVRQPTSTGNRTILSITGAQLYDAGTYTCGGRNPHDLSTTVSIIVGVIGECIHASKRVARWGTGPDSAGGRPGPR